MPRDSNPPRNTINPHEKEGLEPGKKKMLAPRKITRPMQAFNAPKTKLTKDLIKRNAATSPLLQLPHELREKIWRYAVGDRLVHLSHRNRHQPFYYSLCGAKVSEEEALAYFHSAEYENKAKSFGKGEDMRVYWHRHASCLDSPIKGSCKTLCLNILGVCRQVYVEANPLLWSTNIWSFQDPYSFTKWMKLRNATQRRSLKKIHLGPNASLSSFPKSVVAKFHKLEELRLDVVLSPQDMPLYGSRVGPYPQAKTIFVIATGYRAFEDGISKYYHSNCTWKDVVTAAKNWQEALVRMQEGRENERREAEQEKITAKKEEAKGFVKVKEPRVVFDEDYAKDSTADDQSQASGQGNGLDEKDKAVSELLAREDGVDRQDETDTESMDQNATDPGAKPKSVVSTGKRKLVDNIGAEEEIDGVEFGAIIKTKRVRGTKSKKATSSAITKN